MNSGCLLLCMQNKEKQKLPLGSFYQISKGTDWWDYLLEYSWETDENKFVLIGDAGGICSFTKYGKVSSFSL